MFICSQETSLQERDMFSNSRTRTSTQATSTRLLHYSIIILKSASNININSHILKELHTKFSGYMRDSGQGEPPRSLSPSDLTVTGGPWDSEGRVEIHVCASPRPHSLSSSRRLRSWTPGHGMQSSRRSIFKDHLALCCYPQNLVWDLLKCACAHQRLEASGFGYEL